MKMIEAISTNCRRSFDLSQQSKKNDKERFSY